MLLLVHHCLEAVSLSWPSSQEARSAFVIMVHHSTSGYGNHSPMHKNTLSTTPEPQLSAPPTTHHWVNDHEGNPSVGAPLDLGEAGVAVRDEANQLTTMQHGLEGMAGAGT